MCYHNVVLGVFCSFKQVKMLLNKNQHIYATLKAYRCSQHLFFYMCGNIRMIKPTITNLYSRTLVQNRKGVDSFQSILLNNRKYISKNQ